MISVHSVQSPIGTWNDLDVVLSKINIGDLAPYFLPKNRLEGLISGNLKIEDPTRNLRITSDNIKTQFLRLDNDSIGELETTLVYDNATKELRLKGQTLNQENYLDFNAQLYFGDREQQKNNLITLNPRNFQLSVLERFLGTLFSEIEGYLTGSFEIKGEFSNLSIVGRGRTRDAGVKIAFAQCFYMIVDTDIDLKPTEISLDVIVLRDPTSGNPVYLI